MHWLLAWCCLLLPAAERVSVGQGLCDESPLEKPAKVKKRHGYYCSHLRLHLLHLQLQEQQQVYSQRLQAGQGCQGQGRNQVR